MQKKPEVKKEKSVEEENAMSTDSPVNVDMSAAEPKDGEEGQAGLSLLGIGGKQIKAGAKKTGKKRTPGEIRIQKGKYTLFSTSPFAVKTYLTFVPS
jgi:hypothetical protein